MKTLWLHQSELMLRRFAVLTQPGGFASCPAGKRIRGLALPLQAANAFD
jgi:hypothetical protein